jgi:hypothetical protein
MRITLTGTLAGLVFHARPPGARAESRRGTTRTPPKSMILANGPACTKSWAAAHHAGRDADGGLGIPLKGIYALVDSVDLNHKTMKLAPKDPDTALKSYFALILSNPAVSGCCSGNAWAHLNPNDRRPTRMRRLCLAGLTMHSMQSMGGTTTRRLVRARQEVQALRPRVFNSGSPRALTRRNGFFSRSSCAAACPVPSP